MAKTGSIIAEGTDQGIEGAVLGDLTPSLTLGQVAANALGGSDSKELIVVDLYGRTAKVFTGADATALSASVTAQIGDHGTSFSRDDNTLKVSPWTGVGEEATLVVVANTAAKPKRSLSSLISAIEDAVLVGNPNFDQGDGVQVIVDQVSEKLYVFNGTAGLIDLTGKNPVAEFTQEVVQSDGTIKNAFE